MTTNTNGDTASANTVQVVDESLKTPSKVSADEYRARHRNKIDTAKQALVSSDLPDLPKEEVPPNACLLDRDNEIGYADLLLRSPDSDTLELRTRYQSSPAFSVVEEGEVAISPLNLTGNCKGNVRPRASAPASKRVKHDALPPLSSADSLGLMQRHGLSHGLVGVVMNYDTYRLRRQELNLNSDSSLIPMHLNDGRSPISFTPDDYVRLGVQWLKHKGLADCSAVKARSSWFNFAKLSFLGQRASALKKAEALYVKVVNDSSNMPGPSPAHPPGALTETPKYLRSGSNPATEQEVARGYHDADAPQVWKQRSVRSLVHQLKVAAYAPHRKRAFQAPSSSNELCARCEALEKTVRSLQQEFLAFGSRMTHMSAEFLASQNNLESTHQSLLTESARGVTLTQQVDQLTRRVEQLQGELAHERRRRRELANLVVGVNHRGVPPAYPESKKDQDHGKCDEDEEKIIKKLLLLKNYMCIWYQSQIYSSMLQSQYVPGY
jgi:hypothetical protein